MKSFKKFAIFGLFLALMAGGMFFHPHLLVRAADVSPATEDKEKSTDKWGDVAENNRKMLEEMKAIEENLDFAKNRSMQRR